MITEKMMNEAFEKWFGEYMPEYDVNLAFNESKDAFQAAFKLLMPIIEKQNKALIFYSDERELEEEYEQLDWNYVNKPNVEQDKGKRARTTLKQIEEELKSLGGRG